MTGVICLFASRVNAAEIDIVNDTETVVSAACVGHGRVDGISPRSSAKLAVNHWGSSLHCFITDQDGNEIAIEKFDFQTNKEIYSWNIRESRVR